MTDNNKKNGKFVGRKSIRLTNEQLENWTNEGVRQYLSTKSIASDINKDYVRQLEEIIRNLILSETTKEEDDVIDNIIRTSEEVR